jgi:hypothetical protein
MNISQIFEYACVFTDDYVGSPVISIESYQYLAVVLATLKSVPALLNRMFVCRTEEVDMYGSTFFRGETAFTMSSTWAVYFLSGIVVVLTSSLHR